MAFGVVASSTADLYADVLHAQVPHTFLGSQGPTVEREVRPRALAGGAGIVVSRTALPSRHHYTPGQDEVVPRSDAVRPPREGDVDEAPRIGDGF